MEEHIFKLAELFNFSCKKVSTEKVEALLKIARVLYPSTEAYAEPRLSYDYVVSGTIDPAAANSSDVSNKFTEELSSNYDNNVDTNPDRSMHMETLVKDPATQKSLWSNGK